MRKLNNEGVIIFIPHQTVIIIGDHQIKEDVGGAFDTWEWEYESIQSLLNAGGKMSPVRRRRRREYNIKTDFRGVE